MPMEFEVKIIEYLQAGASGFWTVFFKIVSILGTYVAIAGLLCAFFFICKKRFLLLGGSLGLGLLVNLILKYIIKRDRPYVAHESIMCLGTGSGYSLPSSHAVCITILAIFLCYIVFYKASKKSTKILTIIASVLAIIMVCLSRMYLGLHYFTDVCTGVALGAIVSITAIIVYEKFIDKWISKWKIFQKKEDKE